MTLGQIIGSGGLGLVAILTMIQIAPVKIDPWSALARAIGRAVNHDIMVKVDSLSEEVRSIRSEMDERGAVECRARILRFSDEILQGQRRSKDHFDSILQDCTHYEQYCRTHPDFKNSMTTISIEQIEDTYKACLSKHSFL